MIREEVDPDEAARALAYLLERVEVDPRTGCWEWALYRSPEGYGRMRWGPSMWRPHRFSYHFLAGYLHKAEPVHHRCGNRGCVNPDHLQKTTAQDNTAEMMGRQFLLDEVEGLRRELHEAMETIQALEEFIGTYHPEEGQA